MKSYWLNRAIPIPIVGTQTPTTGPRSDLDIDPKSVGSVNGPLSGCSGCIAPPRTIVGNGYATLQSGLAPRRLRVSRANLTARATRTERWWEHMCSRPLIAFA